MTASSIDRSDLWVSKDYRDSLTAAAQRQWLDDYSDSWLIGGPDPCEDMGSSGEMDDSSAGILAA